MDWWLRDTAIRNHGNGKTIKERNTLIISYKQKRGLRRKSLEQIETHTHLQKHSRMQMAPCYFMGGGV